MDHTGNTTNKGKVIPYLSIKTIPQQEAHTYLVIHLYGVILPSCPPPNPPPPTLEENMPSVSHAR